MNEEVKIYSTEIVIGNKSFFGLDKDLVNLVENLTIDKLNAELKRDKYKEVLDKIKNNNKRIIDYGFDYDGFNNVEDLKKLIDMLVDYAKQNDKLLEEIE